MMLAVNLASFFEAAMLVCFGVSWPVAIAKTLRVKMVHGKSFFFLALVFLGYCSGMAAKFVKAQATQTPLEWVTVLYAINAAMVAFDGVLYLKYRTRGRIEHPPEE